MSEVEEILLLDLPATARLAALATSDTPDKPEKPWLQPIWRYAR